MKLHNKDLISSLGILITQILIILSVIIVSFNTARLNSLLVLFIYTLLGSATYYLFRYYQTEHGKF